jgi:hypothetical protein
VRCAQKMARKGVAGKGSRSKVAEVQNMARHVLRIALVLWLSGSVFGFGPNQTFGMFSRQFLDNWSGKTTLVRTV